MRALVISGGGSKGAFAGGVADYLLNVLGKDYDAFVATSTGSLMIAHLALGRTKELQKIYSNVDQETIFSNCPFRIKKYKGHKTVSINHFNTLKNFLRGSKTFGESHNLREMIEENLSDALLNEVRKTQKEIVVTVSNLTLNRVEFIRLSDVSNRDFRDFVWASSNFVPFMSLMVKNKFEYADGGFANLVPINEAIRMGAEEIDAIVLETEIPQLNRLHSKNPFHLITNVFGFMQMQLERFNISVGKYRALHEKVRLKVYYTPRVLTTNSLIFDKKKMRKWWKDGFRFAQQGS